MRKCAPGRWGGWRRPCAWRETGPFWRFSTIPPLYTGYRCPEIIAKLEEYGVRRCFYGHLHGTTHRRAVEGERSGVDYALVSADYLGFIPKKILE